MPPKPFVCLVAIEVALTGYIGYNFIHVPQQRQVRLIREQIAHEHTKRQAAIEVAALLDQRTQYQTRLPSEPDTSWLARDIVALAENAGVQLTTITQETPQSFEQFTRLGVSLKFNASYHQLGAFIDDLERSAHFIHVEQMSVGRSGRDEAASVQVTCSTLYLPPPLPVPSGGS